MRRIRKNIILISTAFEIILILKRGVFKMTNSWAFTFKAKNIFIKTSNKIECFRNILN
jgi:hypothetical protein